MKRLLLGQVSSDLEGVYIVRLPNSHLLKRREPWPLLQIGEIVAVFDYDQDTKDVYVLTSCAKNSLYQLVVGKKEESWWYDHPLILWESFLNDFPEWVEFFSRIPGLYLRVLQKDGRWTPV